MTNKTIEKIIKNSPHLSFLDKGTFLFCVHGSRAYGTNTEASDTDHKGISIPSLEYFFSASKKFEQAELKDPDTVIYDIKKFFNLAIQCNPNILEVLYCDQSDIIICNELGELLLENRDLFLSKRARFSFSGYAISQLRRLNLHKKYLLQGKPNKPTREQFGLKEISPIPTGHINAAKAAINKELDKLNFKFLDQLENSERIEVRNQCVDLLTEFKIYHDDQYIAMARKIGFDDNITELLKKERAYDNAKSEYDRYIEWETNRNKERAKDEAKFGYDLKHAYHLIRLLRMAEEILLTQKVVVKRPDREELLAIRNGAWTFEKLLEEANKIEDKMNDLYEKSNLQNKPDIKKIDHLCQTLIEKHFNK